MDRFTITSVKAETIPALLHKLQADPGTKVQIVGDGTDFMIVGHGVTAEAKYTGTSILVVTIQHKPFFVPVSMIQSQLQQEIDAIQA